MTTLPVLSASDRRRGIASAIASLTSVAIGLGAALPLLALELQRQGVSGLMIGVSSAVPAIGGLLITPFFPWLLRRFDTRSLLLVSVTISAACLFAYYLIPNVWVWFPIRFVNGIVLVILFVVSETQINQLADDSTRGKLIGLYGTALAFGFAAGPVVLVLAGSTGFAPYLAIAILVLLASIPISLAPPMERGGHGPARGVFAFIPAAPTATFAALTFGALEQGSMTLLPVYGVRGGLTEEFAALFLTAFAAGNILSQLPLGLLADRIDRRLLLVLCALVSAMAIVLLPFARGTVFAAPVIFVFGGVVSGLYTVGLALLGQRFSGADLAASNAAFVMMYNFGGLAGPAIGGAAMENWPGYGLPLVFAVIALVYAAVASWRYMTISRHRAS
jgi:MFS family permease